MESINAKLDEIMTFMNNINAKIDAMDARINDINSVINDISSVINKITANQEELDKKLVGMHEISNKAISTMKTIIFHNSLLENYAKIGTNISQSVGNAVKSSGEPRPAAKSEMPEISNTQEVKVVSSHSYSNDGHSYSNDESQYIDDNNPNTSDSHSHMNDRHSNTNDRHSHMNEKSEESIELPQEELSQEELMFKNYFIEMMLKDVPIIVNNAGKKFAINAFMGALSITVGVLTTESCTKAYDEASKRCARGDIQCIKVMNKIRDSFEASK